MNTKRIVTSILIACVAFVGGTSCTNPLQPITPSESIPLKIGNQWDYESANYLPVFNDTLIRRFTSRIVADTIIKGKKYFIENIDAGFLITIIQIQLPDGAYQRIGSKDILGTKYPVKLGDKYQVESYDRFGQLSDTLNIEITALNKEVTVEAGKFQCYEKTYFIGSYKYVDHTAPGHGWIQGLTYDSTGTLVARVQLTSYTIQK